MRNLSLRRAISEDCLDIFMWRNDSYTRAASFKSDPVTLNDHNEWFSSSLIRADRILLIGELDGNKIGILRFDIENAGIATVSININPTYRKKGFGPEMLLLGEGSVPPGVLTLIALIKPENSASISIFEKAGYKRDDTSPETLRYLKTLEHRAIRQ